jgi:hypothetical protein
MGSCFSILTRWQLSYLYRLGRSGCTRCQVLHRAAECRLIAKGLPEQLRQLATFAALRSDTISALWRGGMLQEGMARLPWCDFLADDLTNGLATDCSPLPPPRWFADVLVAPPEESY